MVYLYFVNKHFPIGTLIESRSTSVLIQEQFTNSYRPICAEIQITVIWIEKEISPSFKDKKKKSQVPPRFELGSLDSESRVLTITPWNLLPCEETVRIYIQIVTSEGGLQLSTNHFDFSLENTIRDVYS